MKRFVSVFILVLLSVFVFSQNQFDREVRNLVLKDSLIKNRNNIILFTGSSTIRLWKNIEGDFPGKNVLNRGFGGSKMSDLLHFADQLIIPYNPRTIFIYEGDNDLGEKKTPKEIMASADSLLSIIRTKLPKNVKVYFISAKPSIARWHLKEQYAELNNGLKSWVKTKKNVYFIDMWPTMLNTDGSIKKELYLEDGLHMNQKGYDLWQDKIKPFVR